MSGSVKKKIVCLCGWQNSHPFYKKGLQKTIEGGRPSGSAAENRCHPCELSGFSVSKGYFPVRWYW